MERAQFSKTMYVWIKNFLIDILIHYEVNAY